MEATEEVCRPVNVASNSPFIPSQILTVLSSDPETILLPSRFHDTEVPLRNGSIM
jgi:hypothetical protein